MTGEKKCNSEDVKRQSIFCNILDFYSMVGDDCSLVQYCTM
jgi:hypothetical protein